MASNTDPPTKRPHYAATTLLCASPGSGARTTTFWSIAPTGDAPAASKHGHLLVGTQARVTKQPLTLAEPRMHFE